MDYSKNRVLTALRVKTASDWTVIVVSLYRGKPQMDLLTGMGHDTSKIMVDEMLVLKRNQARQLKHERAVRRERSQARDPEGEQA